MTIQVTLSTRDVRSLRRQIRNISSPGVLARASGISLRRMAAPIRKVARQRNFEFTDRRGSGEKGLSKNKQTGKYRSLRSSIRIRGFPGRYGTARRYKNGRAAIFAGGPGARQAHLVHAGHGPPIVSKPYPFLRRAILIAQGAAATAFVSSMRTELPRHMRAAAKRLQRTVQTNTYNLSGSLRARGQRRVFRARQSIRRTF